MGIAAALVLFAVIWFVVLFVVLPLGIKTQGESGNIITGSPASAPEDARLKHKIIAVTLITIPLWLLCTTVISSKVISIEDLDIYSRFKPQ